MVAPPEAGRFGSRRVGEVLADCLRSHDLQTLVSIGPWGRESAVALVDAAIYHRLDNLLTDLAAPDGGEALGELGAVLMERRATHLRRQAALGGDLALVKEVLEEADLDWLVLKGPVTAERHYDRPFQRSFTDLDILVRPHQFEMAVSLMVDRGARLLEGNWNLVRQLGCGELNLILPFGTPLDLHWAIIAAPHDRRAFRVFAEDMLERRVIQSLGNGQHVPAPDPTDELIHLCLHAVIGGTSSLGRWHDVASAFNGPFDEDELVQRSRAWGVELPVAVALERVMITVPGRREVLLRGLATSSGWRGVMRGLGKFFPATSTPPVTRWSSYMKLTRATARESYLYSLTELLGFAMHPLVQRARDDWDPVALRTPDGNELARREYFRDVFVQGHSRGSGSTRPS